MYVFRWLDSNPIQFSQRSAFFCIAALKKNKIFKGGSYTAELKWEERLEIIPEKIAKAKKKTNKKQKIPVPLLFIWFWN